MTHKGPVVVTISLGSTQDHVQQKMILPCKGATVETGARRLQFPAEYRDETSYGIIDELTMIAC